MKKLTIYTFKGEPNLLIRSAGDSKVSFRFNKKGLLEVMDGNPYIPRLKKRFKFTVKEYNLTAVKPKAKPKKAVNKDEQQPKRKT